jgi:hypothetical protein
VSNILHGLGPRGPTREQRAAFLTNTWADLFKACLTGEIARVGGDATVTVNRAAELADIAMKRLMLKTNEMFKQGEVADG